MKTAVLSAVIGGALVALAFVTNPSPDQHRTTIKAVISERSPLAGALGLGALTAFTSNYHALGVASYTTANGRTLSVGAFGMVFVMQASNDK